MVLILNGKSEQVAHTGWKIGLFGEKKYPMFDCYRSYQMPYKIRECLNNIEGNQIVHQSTPNIVILLGLQKAVCHLHYFWNLKIKNIFYNILTYMTCSISA